MANNEYDGLVEHYCPICNKIFFPTPAHAYRANGKSYCSWTCYNRRFKNPAGKRGSANKKVEMLTLDGVHVRYFDSAIDAMDHVKGCPTGIYKACYNETSYKGYLWRYVI